MVKVVDLLCTFLTFSSTYVWFSCLYITSCERSSFELKNLQLVEKLFTFLVFSKSFENSSNWYDNFDSDVLVGRLISCERSQFKSSEFATYFLWLNLINFWQWEFLLTVMASVADLPLYPPFGRVALSPITPVKYSFVKSILFWRLGMKVFFWKLVRLSKINLSFNKTSSHLLLQLTCFQIR